MMHTLTFSLSSLLQLACWVSSYPLEREWGKTQLGKNRFLEQGGRSGVVFTVGRRPAWFLPHVGSSWGVGGTSYATRAMGQVQA